MKKVIGYASFLFICYLAYKQVQVSGLFDTYKLNMYMKVRENNERCNTSVYGEKA